MRVIYGVHTPLTAAPCSSSDNEPPSTLPRRLSTPTPLPATSLLDPELHSVNYVCQAVAATVICCGSGVGRCADASLAPPSDTNEGRVDAREGTSIKKKKSPLSSFAFCFPPIFPVLSASISRLFPPARRLLRPPVPARPPGVRHARVSRVAVATVSSPPAPTVSLLTATIPLRFYR